MPPPAASDNEKQQAAQQAVDILHEISTILVRSSVFTHLFIYLLHSRGGGGGGGTLTTTNYIARIAYLLFPFQI